MKFCTIFAKHTELGSKASPESAAAGGGGSSFSAMEILKSRFSRDFTTGFAGVTGGACGGATNSGRSPPAPASIG